MQKKFSLQTRANNGTDKELFNTFVEASYFLISSYLANYSGPIERW
jgi:hypothetical protein